MIKVIRMSSTMACGLAYSWMMDFLTGFSICQGLRPGYVLSPSLFSIFLATGIILVLQLFAADPVIVSDLEYLDNAPKGEDGRSREDGTLGMVGRAASETPHADDAELASTSPRRRASMMDRPAVACQ